MSIAMNAVGETIETGVDPATGRVWILNHSTGERITFPPEHAISVAIHMAEYVTNDDDRGFVRHHWGDLELDWDPDEEADGG